MVEKYKREGIYIVLDSRKCIYTDEKNKKFIKQNKKYFPIIKRKGKYVIINKKGGGLETDKLKITLEKLNNELAKYEKDKDSFMKELNKKSKNTGFFSGNITGDLKLQNSINELIPKISIIKQKINIEKKKLKELERHEEWNKSSPNLEKEQFLKEITEKEELIKSLQENHIDYINKMKREEIYLDNYIKEKKNDIPLDLMSGEMYNPFLFELLFKRIIELEKRIKS